jgi:hypothetical protein
MDENYIIVMDTGICFLTKIITQDMMDDLHGDISSIIRCSDAKELDINGKWVKMTSW